MNTVNVATTKMVVFPSKDVIVKRFSQYPNKSFEQNMETTIERVADFFANQRVELSLLNNYIAHCLFSKSESPKITDDQAKTAREDLLADAFLNAERVKNLSGGVSEISKRVSNVEAQMKEMGIAPASEANSENGNMPKVSLEDKIEFFKKIAIACLGELDTIQFWNRFLLSLSSNESSRGNLNAPEKADSKEN